MSFAMLLLVTLVVDGWIAAAWPAEYFPNPMTDVSMCGREQEGWVCDPNHILSLKARDQSEAVVATIAQECLHSCGGRTVGYEVGVAIMGRMDHPAWSKADVVLAKSFAIDIGERWGVGHAECDDGIMLLVSRKDRLSYIQTGHGARRVLTDWRAGIVIEHMNAYFKAGKMDEGVVGALLLIRDALSGKDLPGERGVAGVLRFVHVALAEEGAVPWWTMWLVRLSVCILMPVAMAAMLAVLVTFLFMLTHIWYLVILLASAVLLPFAFVADLATDLRQRIMGQPNSVKADDATQWKLQVIRQEVEGMQDDKQYTQRICPICLEDFVNKKNQKGNITQLECNHRFHKQCMQSWARDTASPTCPLCWEDAVVVSGGSTKAEDGEDRAYKARLRHYISRLDAHSETPGPDIDAEAARLYKDRRNKNWTLHRKPARATRKWQRTWVQSLPVFSDAAQRSSTLSAAYAKSSGSETSKPVISKSSSSGPSKSSPSFGGGKLRSGGGAGGSW